MGQTQGEQQSARYESTIQAVHRAARIHTQRSKGAVGPTVDYRPQCEKRKPKYTSRVPKSTLSLYHYARRKHLLWLRPRSYLLLCNVK